MSSKDLFGQYPKFFAYICLMYNNMSLISIWQQLEAWDKGMFIRLNSEWTNPFFDSVFPFIRHSLFWAPLYLFIAVFIALNFGRKGLWWSLLFICTIALTDMAGTRLFKEVFQRLRPCQDPEFRSYVRLLLQQCSGHFSFVSNHAANHFGMATFVLLTFRGLFHRWMYLALAWAFFIGYAQVYVGVHYPLDVLGGAAVGVLAGVLTSWLFHKKWGYIHLESN